MALPVLSPYDWQSEPFGFSAGLSAGLSAGTTAGLSAGPSAGRYVWRFKSGLWHWSRVPIGTLVLESLTLDPFGPGSTGSSVPDE